MIRKKGNFLLPPAFSTLRRSITTKLIVALTEGTSKGRMLM